MTARTFFFVRHACTIIPRHAGLSHGDSSCLYATWLSAEWLEGYQTNCQGVRIAFLPPPVYVAQYAECASIRVLSDLLTPRDLQAIAPHDYEAYEKWLVSAGGRGADTEVLPDGRSSLLWMGNRKRASKVVLFFHGGGYVAPLELGHLEACAKSFVRADVAVAVLQYSLFPEACYPVQLLQAADADAPFIELPFETTQHHSTFPDTAAEFSQPQPIAASCLHSPTHTHPSCGSPFQRRPGTGQPTTNTNPCPCC